MSKGKFQPIKVPIGLTSSDRKGFPLTISTTIYGEAGKQFEQMVADNNLNRSALLRQMVLFCLGREQDLEAMKRQLMLWGMDESCK